MSENSKNKEIKTSGLRPPSKIPPVGVSRIPSSSSIKLDGVHSTVTKLDGGSTKKMADMAHASKHNGVNKKTTDERKSSSGSDSFMGDARRLSEAGVRRSSGNSVVLTEDTDKFIIGNRIWVGGTKPGHISYIGETNFGSGDWAGIVLDEPIGKNDGSVGGTRYFQCGPKKGIFARLTNLTLAPLGSVEDSMIQSSFATTKPLGFSTPMPKRQASTVSTVSSVKAAPKSISQPTPKASSDLKIGDRVIISSGQGSKLGVLRYRGMTQFASGEWCGIELDDPLGKNNGTVEGIKYFECEDKFGLFTPVSKVSKSPMSATRMATNCAIHKNKRSPGSMNGSMVSGVTTNTMSSIPTRRLEKASDLDRLKLQMTQMKNENELLRSQVIKAANQADVAEKRLEETLKAKIDRPSETQVSNILVLQNQLDNLKKQIEEDKEKVQNLQFTNEEQNVVNIELQNKNSELLTKIKELDFELDKERNLAKDIEKERMKIFEKEEELCRVREELETLKKLIDNNADELQKSVSSLSSEVVDKETILNNLRQTLNENSQTYDRLLKEANEKLVTTTERLNKEIEEKNKKLEQNQEMIDQLNEGIKCLSALKNDEHDDIVNNLKNELTKLKNECQMIIDKKEQDNKTFSENHIKIENELRQELKSLLENKNREIEELQNKCTDFASSSSAEKDVTEKLKLELNIATKDLKMLKVKNLVYSKETLQTILDQQIQSTLVFIEDLKMQFDKSVSLKDKQIESCNLTLLQVKEHLIKSKSSLEITLNDKLKEKDNEIKNLFDKINELNGNVEQLKEINKNVTKELEAESKSVQDKTALLADLEKKYNNLEYQQALSRNELEKELTTKLKSINDEMESLKLKKSTLEDKHKRYVTEMASTKTEMDSKLQQNNVLIENLNKSLEALTLSKQNELDSMNKRLSELEKERDQIFNQQKVELGAKDEQINALSEKLEQTLTEKQKLDLNNAYLQTVLTNEATMHQSTANNLLNKINELEEKLVKNHESFKTELDQSNNEKETVKTENLNLLEKLKSLENLKLNLEEKLASNKINKQDIQNLNDAIREKTKIIDDNQIKMKQLDDLIVQTKSKYEIVLNEKEEEIKELLKIGQEKMNLEKLSLEEKTKVILDEKDKEISILEKKIKDLENVKISFEKQLEESKSKDQDLKKLNEVVLEKIKIIEDKNLNIELLNSLVSEAKNELEAKLQKKDKEIQELSKLGEEKLQIQKEQIEKQAKVIVDEKDKENSNLLKKINILEKAKVDLEKQLEVNKTHENTITELNKLIEQKIKIIEDNNSNIKQLNGIIAFSKDEFSAKLKEKEDSIKEFMKMEEQKFINEKLSLEKNYKIQIDEKDKEILNLVDKINTSEDTKISFEKQLEIIKIQEHDMAEMKKLIEEKTKIIDENNSKIELLNNTIVSSKEEFNEKLKEKEDKITEFIKSEEKLTGGKLKLEENSKAILDKKDKEISCLVEKLKNLEEEKLSIKKQLEVNNTQDGDITELKKTIEEKTKSEDENKSKIELLNNIFKQTKEDFDVKLKEKENEIDKLSKMEEDKLTSEKIAFETRLKTCVDEKNTEINELKTQLQEIVDNNTEKELILKLESVANDLEKEKIRASNLEKIKSELDRIVLEHKTELELLEASKNDTVANMTKTIEEQQVLNAKLNEEMNRLKPLLEKDCSAQSHLEFRIQELTDENHRLNERIEANSNVLQQNNNFAQEKSNIEKKYEETYSMLKIKENQILVLQTELNSWKLKDMSNSKNGDSQGKTDKTEAYILAEKNEEIKMLNSIILGLHKKLSAVMETDVSELEIEKNPSGVSKEEYQKLYKTAKNNIKLKECESLSLKQEIHKLKTENEQYFAFKDKCEKLENDKKALQKLIVNYESSNTKNVKNEKSDSKSETEKILEEKDWQINLLNNIIADLHSKVSNNKFKIDALEKQILDSGMNQNKKVRLRTTRLYCERCEIFDSHDTEDCPEKPESPKFQRKHRAFEENTNKSMDKPFCVCCDMFGHNADDCDTFQTF